MPPAKIGRDNASQHGAREAAPSVASESLNSRSRQNLTALVVGLFSLKLLKGYWSLGGSAAPLECTFP